MKHFDESFRKALRKAVQDIEAVSGAEIVVAVLPRVGRYRHVSFLAGIILSLPTFTALMFLPREFHYIHIYLDTIATFALGVGLVWAFPAIKRWVVGPKEMKRWTEMKARAIFQRAGISETSRRIGILVVFSYLERQAIILPDRGAEEAIPPDLLNAMQKEASAAIQSSDPATAIIKVLNDAIAPMRDYIPREPNDVNELPDDLWLE